MKGLASKASCAASGSEKTTSISWYSTPFDVLFACLLVNFDLLKVVTGPKACNRRRMAVDWAIVTNGGEMMTREIELGLGTFFTGMVSRNGRRVSINANAGEDGFQSPSEVRAGVAGTPPFDRWTPSQMTKHNDPGWLRRGMQNLKPDWNPYLDSRLLCTLAMRARGLSSQTLSITRRSSSTLQCSPSLPDSPVACGCFH